MKNILISISKGRIFKELIYFIYSKKIILKNNIKKRKLYYKTNKKNIFITIIKNKDINKYIKKNYSDIIFLGKDILIEKNLNIFIKNKNINISKSKLYIISNKILKNKLKINYLKIKTKYINISKKYFEYKNIKIKIFKINTSNEIYLLFKNSNIIIDLIGTGKTCYENKIFKLEELIKFNTSIVINFNLICKKFFLIIFRKIFYKNVFN